MPVITRNRIGYCSAAVLAIAAGVASLTLAQSTPKTPPQGQLIQQRYDAEVKPLLVKHCYRCHGNGEQKGDVALDKYSDLTSIQKDRKRWNHLRDMVTQKLMPPEDRPALKPDEITMISTWVHDALNYYDCTGPRDPGRVAIHRLNRTEYNNTIRDLVGVDFQPADDFPNDDSGYGFDNIADVLTMSPLLAEKYLAAAEQVMDKAIVTVNPNRQKVTKLDGDDLFTNAEVVHDYRAVVKAEYEVRIRATGDQAGTEPPKMTLRVDGKNVQTWEVPNVRGRPRIFKQRLTLDAGNHKIAAAYINNYVNTDHPDPKQRGDRNLYVEAIEIDGPIDAPPPPPGEVQKRIIFVTPGADVSEAAAFKQVATRFATRAFRRPATDDELTGLLRLYKLARAEGDDSVASTKTALTAVLVSPHFLFRIELDPPEKPGQIRSLTDYELATRLSYFLWSSMPDPALFELAEKGTLRDPAILEAQVRRMLADRKAQELVANFGGQWLELRNLDTHTADAKLFSEFDYPLKVAMKREAELYLTNLIKEDRSIVDLIDSNYTFLNERLAKHYGIEGVAGERFQRVALKDSPRGGVLTMGAVLTVTAMPTRTSPVKRGHFIMEQVLGASPPPPPAEVPALEEQPAADQNAPLRQRMEKHRADPNCAVCHVRMDSIGFALENFDAIGRFRTTENGKPIDASGSLPEGITFTGASELKRYLLQHKKEFAHALAEKMLIYALGRGLEPSDRCTIEDIVKATEQNDYRVSSLILAIVKSDAFQKRRM